MDILLYYLELLPIKNQPQGYTSQMGKKQLKSSKINCVLG